MSSPLAVSAAFSTGISTSGSGAGRSPVVLVKDRDLTDADQVGRIASPDRYPQARRAIKAAPAPITTRSTTTASAPNQPLDGVVELANLRPAAAAPNRLGHAVLRVIGEQLQRHALECRPGGIDLSQDVDAVAVLVDHLLDAPYLAFDPAQPGQDGALVLRIAAHGFIIPPGGIALPATS